MNLLKEIHRKDNLNFNGIILFREAVRGIIFRDNKVLLIHSENKNYDYKFPGGGIENNETYEEALKREILEETGYKSVSIEKEFGKVIEFDIPQEKEFDLFKTTSYYFMCEVLECALDQKLDDYEKELGFKAKWVDINSAITNNEELLKNSDAPRWTKRETFILKEVRKYMEKFK